MIQFIPIILVSSIGLSVCISYLLYHAVLFFKERKTRQSKKEEVFEFYDEQERGDSLIIDLKNINVD